MNSPPPFDLCPKILSFLLSTDLKACSLVNHAFRHTAQTILFSEIWFIRPSHPDTRIPLSEKLNIYLDEERGRELSQLARALTIEPELFDDYQASRLAALLQNTQNISSLSLQTRYKPWGEMNSTALNAIRLHILPHIHHLRITAVFQLDFCDFLADCKVLRRLEICESYFDVMGIGGIFVQCPTLNDLSLEEWTFGSRPGNPIFDEWPSSTRTVLRRFSVNPFPWPRSNGFDMAHFLHGFTNLESLSLGVKWYRPIGYDEERSSSPSLPHFSQLRNLTFRMEEIYAEGWSSFLFWLGKLISRKYSGLQDICLECEYLAFIDPCKFPIKQSYQLAFPDFNGLAVGSSVRLKVILQSLNYKPPLSEVVEQLAFEQTAQVVKTWLACWYQSGKLEILRRSW